MWTALVFMHLHYKVQQENGKLHVYILEIGMSWIFRIDEHR